MSVSDKVRFWFRIEKNEVEKNMTEKKLKEKKKVEKKKVENKLQQKKELEKELQGKKEVKRITSLDFNYVKPCLDLIKLKLQLLTL